MLTPALIVLTFNVLYDGADDHKSLAVIAREDADVVCLQEVTPRFRRLIEKSALAARYPHRVIEARAGTWGIAVLSKHAIARREIFAQSPHKMPAIEVDIDVDLSSSTTANAGASTSRRLRVLCAHLFPPGAARFANDDLATTMAKNAELRVQQAGALVARTRGVANVVIAGDLNEGRDDRAVRALVDAGFAHACASAGSTCGPTWPGAVSAWPALFEIDHVLGRGVTFARARVVKDGGSDHFPVVAVLSLAAAAQEPAAAARPRASPRTGAGRSPR